MRMKKAVLTKLLISASAITLFACPAMAEWKQNIPDSTTTAELQDRLERLQRENEQLRNAIAQMRLKKTHEKPVEHKQPAQDTVSTDTRIHALIEENKRLLSQIRKNEALGNSEDKTLTYYAAKITSLNQSNEVLSQEIQDLKNENKELMNMRSFSTKTNKEIHSLKGQIRLLQNENESLRAQNDYAVKGNEEMKLLQAQLKELKDKNLTLEAEKRTLLSKNESNAQNTTKEQDERLALLQKSLDSLKKENMELSQKLASSQEAVPSSPASPDNTKELEALKSQNDSLRKTIQAQTEMLTRQSNAENAAETLISENASLKKQLEQAHKATTSNDETTKDLITRYQQANIQIKKQNEYITRLEGLKDTVKQLRMENDRYAAGHTAATSVTEELKELQGKNNALEEDIARAKEAATAYRTEIAKYQNKIKELEEGEELIKADNSTNQKQEDIITALKLENHELKARIELLTAKNQKSVVFKNNKTEENKSSEVLLDVQSEKETSSQYIEKKSKTAQDTYQQDNVKIIETSYPKVDKVLPILNAKGEHIYDGMKSTKDNNETKAPAAEDLLQQKPKPLSEN